GHTLSVITLKAELANRLLEQDRARARQEMQDVERICRQALAEVREAISGYHTRDFMAEIECARSTLQTAGLTVESVCEPINLSVAHERVLALVVREAVTNIVCAISSIGPG
ncbi:MAG TPA: histidine kinase, partial [Steroidobacteraceae bacterium]|nr:histidine kinase [Steroidobacteraceae bacterium]